MSLKRAKHFSLLFYFTGFSEWEFIWTYIDLWCADPQALPGECVLVFVFSQSTTNHLGKVISVTIMEKQTAVSPGLETILSLSVSYSFFFFFKWRTHCLAEESQLQFISLDYGLLVSLLQTGCLWIFPTSTKWLFHHYKWACLNLLAFSSYHEMM